VAAMKRAHCKREARSSALHTRKRVYSSAVRVGSRLRVDRRSWRFA
jgi:hypothetical protein